MSIEVVCMTKDGAHFIKEVLQSYQGIGKIKVFIDNKTTDNTATLVQDYDHEFFTFTNFSSSRNYILSRCNPEAFKFFIDDSFVFVGNPLFFRFEVLMKKLSCVSIMIHRGSLKYSSKRITRNQHYTGLIHEDISSKSEYLIKSGYLEDRVCDEHILRTLKRAPSDLKILFADYYHSYSPRTVYYIAQTLLLMHKFKLSSTREVLYWINQRNTMPGIHREKDILTKVKEILILQPTFDKIVQTHLQNLK